ncbi:MAG: polysaccharide deacetylase family protein [Gammaproteobacteria bacterium]|nr:polysaccharide deacetylase family protein [Gammaproteobacteria bacterium]NIR84995.1 polysaccharide deacetylase family protein [Gammaproteobacteria bacterium]NIR88262.1 polysaccharide deacetylase family protein [Gammaproteobacteria bacterium]NIU06042.1 polysaccharide deacetylase family protein [Gammaproteobacteria bacterium]NIV73461.1 polysaccharide deacetylase family protein [Gammaproteobacteria bacterium]
MSSNPRIPFEMAHQRRPLAGPEGKTLLVHLVVNVEHWRFGQPMPRKILTAPHGAEQIPDIPNFSWAEYGMRAGMPRILGMFAERGLPASTSINAGVIDAYPACAEAMLEADWEFIGHGIHQKSVQGEQDEAGLVQQALDELEAFSGRKTRGWLSPGLKESDDTPDILKRAGVDYVCDWVLDDLPAWMETKHGPLIAMPYNLEVNDSVIYAVEKHGSPEMFTRLRDTVERFDKEMADGTPRVLALGLHPHLIGVPHRIGYLEKMLDLLMNRGDTVFMTGSEIADWFVAADRGGK